MVEQIKQRVTLRDTLEVLGVVDKGHGKALCPLHSDKTPSLSYKDAGLWYCFVCGVGGDMFELVMKVENLTFKESLSWFNEKFSLGLTNKRYRPDPYLEALNENYEALKESFRTEIDALVKHYHFLLSMPQYIWFAQDFNFEFCYHDKLDEIEDKLRRLDDVRYRLRARKITSR